MKINLPVSADALEVVFRLQQAGFETYIVGGAIRDMLLNRTPKDFDISTAATPEEIRGVFGRRNARIIGKRFRLAHVFVRKELFEVATFRRAPGNGGRDERNFPGKDTLPENLIVSDNAFGTSKEDAWRRDFTVNALFYDPAKSTIIDYTEKGISDIEKGIVRAIGNPALRFEEDPIRILRALKLAGQYDFELENATEKAIFTQLPLFDVASISRRTLELEKILQSVYGDRHLEVFHEYGLLEYFLPVLNKAWGKASMEYAMDLFYERNCRMDEGCFRNSISLAMATLALPFVEEQMGSDPGTLWEPGQEADEVISGVVENLFSPQNMMVRMRIAAARILSLLPLMARRNQNSLNRIFQSRSYGHARELLLIRAAVAGNAPDELERIWPQIPPDRPRNPRRRKH